MKDGKV